MATAKLYDVFLSHASADKPAVEALAERLRALDLMPFLDKWHLVPGEPWQEALEEALDQSCTCAVFLGPGDLGPWQNEEMRSALSERVRSPAFRVIPVLLPGAPEAQGLKLPRFLSRLTWVDFRSGLDDKEAFDRLLCGILGIAPGPAGTPAARPPRVEARLEQIPRDMEVVEAARSAFGEELSKQRLGELEAELDRLRQIPPVQLSVHGTQASAGSIAVGGSVEKSILISGDGNTIVTTDPDTGIEELLATYYRSLAQECSELPLAVIDARFTPSGEDKLLGLPEVYVDLDVIAARTGPESDEPEAFGYKVLRMARGEGGERTPLAEAVADPAHRLGVLLGDAGTGKTTFAHYLAHQLATGGSGVPEALAGRLPVRLVLREVAARHLPAGAEKGHAGMLWGALREDFERRVGGEASGQLFQRFQARLLRGGVVFLLDGLDEVPEAQERRRVLLEAVGDLAAGLPESGRVLVTARPYAYADPKWQLPRFTTLALAPFDKGQVERFVERWYQALPSGLGASRESQAERAGELAAALRARAYLADLASRPLLLTLMAALHASGGKLPEDRADLYEQIVELLLSRWQRQRLTRDAAGNLVAEPGISQALGVGEEKIRRRLEELAFKSHERQRGEGERQEDSADIPETEVLGVFKPVLEQVGPEGLLGFLRDRVGLLVARRDGVYTFPHRSFQEYLAACWLTGRPSAERELAHCVTEDPIWWREVFLLAVGKIRQGGLDPAASAVRRLLAGMPQDGDLPWHLAALAGEALVELRLIERAEEDLPVYEDLVLGEVRRRLAELIDGGHLPPRERLEAGDSLGRLGDPRPGVGVVVLGDRRVPEMEWVEIPGGEFRMGSEEGEEGASEDEQPAHTLNLPAFYLARYPVTNAQFGAFVDGGGYEREELWTEEGWAWRQGAEADLSVIDGEEWKEKYKDWLAGRPAEKRNQPFWWEASKWSSPSRPVVGITWYEAVAYCRWLEEAIRETPWWRAREADLEGHRIRLPSEAEWEKAARGGKGYRWPWGNDFGGGPANTREAGVGQTSAVGMFPAGRNLYGLDDLAGNVLEWTLSRWGRRSFFKPDYGYPYDASDGREALSGPDARVVRGGSWILNVRYARCAARDRSLPTRFYFDLGFRCGVFPG